MVLILYKKYSAGFSFFAILLLCTFYQFQILNKRMDYFNKYKLTFLISSLKKDEIRIYKYKSSTYTLELAYFEFIKEIE